MSTVTIPNSPVHSDSILTAVYGETVSKWAISYWNDFAPQVIHKSSVYVISRVMMELWKSNTNKR